MATGTTALAQKLVKGNKSAKPATSTKSAKSAPSKSKGTSNRGNVPWKQIADLYNSGMSVPEISDKLKLTRLKTKKGKDNPYPYYLMVGYLTKLSHGVEVDGKTIQIVRGAKNKKRAAAKKEEKE